jgi:hypothetical protein
MLCVRGFALVSFAQDIEPPRFATTRAVVLATIAWKPALVFEQFFYLAPILLRQSCHTVRFYRQWVDAPCEVVARMALCVMSRTK